MLFRSSWIDRGRAGSTFRSSSIEVELDRRIELDRSRSSWIDGSSWLDNRRAGSMDRAGSMVVELDRLDKSSWIDNRRAGSMDRAGSMVVELARWTELDRWPSRAGSMDRAGSMVVELDRLDKSSWIDNRRAGSMDRAGSTIVELARWIELDRWSSSWLDSYRINRSSASGPVSSWIDRSCLAIYDLKYRLQ